MIDKKNRLFFFSKMTNEFIDWSGENRVRTPLRGGGCNNFLNNNYTNQKFISGMGLKANTLMKSTQRPKGKEISFGGICLFCTYTYTDSSRFTFTSIQFKLKESERISPHLTHLENPMQLTNHFPSSSSSFILFFLSIPTNTE